MDAIDAASSDEDESQATQMLIDLVPRSSSVADPLSPAPATKIQSPFPLDVPESFASSRHSNSLPTYHYHGLASTQTQTQTQVHDEDVEIQEGSQKENVQSASVVTASEAGQMPLTHKLLPNASSSKATTPRTAHVEHTSHSRMSHSKARTPNTRPVAIGLLDSPSRGESGTSRRTRPLPRRPGRRGDSPVQYPMVSQDSFAQDPLQNAEDLFIIGNDLLKRPLADLGRADSPEPEDPVRRSMTRPAFDNPIISRALLESTSSQSQSQEPTQIITKHYGLPSTTSAPSGRSSPPFPSHGSSGGASCFEEGTQQSAEQAYQTQPTQLVGAALIAATTASGDVLNLVPGANRPRFGLEGLEHLQETQPATAEELRFTRRPNFAMPSRSTHATAGSSAPAQRATATHSANDSNMDDVIPDSEPPANPASPGNVQNELDRAVPPARKSVDKGKGRALIQDNEVPGGDDELLLVNPPVTSESREAGDEGEGESDDDDLPLLSKSKKKGKQGTRVARTGKPGSSTTPVTRAGTTPRSAPSALKKAGAKSGSRTRATRSKVTVKATGATPKVPPNRSPDSSFVPSSMPQQDYANASASVQPKKATKRAPAKTPAKTPGRAKRNASRKNYQELTDEEELVEETEDPICDPAPKTGRPTGKAREEEEDSPEPEQGSGRKRKRGTANPDIKQEGNKRLKAEISLDWENATRVRALWAQTDSYYPGRIFSRIDAGTYHVKFDDGHEATLPSEQIRKFELAQGDIVKVGSDRNWTVIGVEPEQESARLKLGKREMATSWANVVISRSHIDDGWDNRKLRPTDQIKTMVNPPILAGTGVVITSIHGTRAHRNSLSDTVKEAGGISMEDFFPFLKMKGVFDCRNDRWTISKKDVKWSGKAIERLFLVADVESTKPKYLFALALGVPCLSEQWLVQCRESRLTGANPDWRHYLLPQATIEGFGDLRLSQQVDLAWGNNLDSLTNIMDNKAPCKLFQGVFILCVGKGLLPPHSIPQTDAQADDVIPRVLLCMGAERVESVLNLSLASMTLDKFPERSGWSRPGSSPASWPPASSPARIRLTWQSHRKSEPHAHYAEFFRLFVFRPARIPIRYSTFDPTGLAFPEPIIHDLILSDHNNTSRFMILHHMHITVQLDLSDILLPLYINSLALVRSLKLWTGILYFAALGMATRRLGTVLTAHTHTFTLRAILSIGLITETNNTSSPDPAE